MKKPITILCTIAALLLQGCGSIKNLAGDEPQNYGGVQRDLHWLDTASDHPLMSSGKPGTNGSGALFLLALVPTEVALSFTIDTLALPYTMYQNHKKHPDDDRPALPQDTVETVIQVPSAN